MISKVLISVISDHVVSAESVENNPFPRISRSLKMSECVYPVTRLPISEERSPVSHHCENKTRTVVKVCCDLYESHRENVLKKVDCHMEMHTITEELVVSSSLCTCGARREGK
jgi:hypothetical protein